MCINKYIVQILRNKPYMYVAVCLYIYIYYVYIYMHIYIYVCVIILHACTLQTVCSL